jgi:hypothetical protein
VKRIKTEQRYNTLDDDINFCPRCGKSLLQGASSCPACGAFLGDPVTDTRRVTAFDDAKGEQRIKKAIIVLLIGAVIALLSGVCVYIFAAEMAAPIFEMIEDIMPGLYTEQELIDLFKMSALMSFFGCAIAFGAAFLSFKKRVWLITLILCIMAIFVTFPLIILSAYWVYKAKPVFKD